MKNYVLNPIPTMTKSHGRQDCCLPTGWVVVWRRVLCVLFGKKAAVQSPAQTPDSTETRAALIALPFVFYLQTGKGSSTGTQPQPTPPFCHPSRRVLGCSHFHLKYIYSLFKYI